MARSTPTTLALPPFTGATRRLILIHVGIFFAFAVMSLVLPHAWYGFLVDHLALRPYDVVHGQIWQLLTSVFLETDIWGTLFAALGIWFVGSILEEGLGSRRLYEIYIWSGVAGSLLLTLLSFTHLLGLDPLTSIAGQAAAWYGLLIVLAIRFGDLEFLLLFIVRIRARYLVAIYILINLALVLKAQDAFGALLRLCGALMGFLYLRYAPRKGLASGASERWFALRNEYYRNKRRRAARKFEVYMRGQNRDVHFDKDGRYIEQDEPGRDPSDKRWMN